MYYTELLLHTPEGFYMTGNWKASGLCTETADKFSTASITSKMQTLKLSMLVYRCVCIQGKKCYISNTPIKYTLDRYALHFVSAGHCPGHLLSTTGTY